MASAEDCRAEPDPTIEGRVRLCRGLIKQRARVGVHLGFDLCPAPAWDILLDLYLARHLGRIVHIWSLCIAANIPTSTAHRHICAMVKSGILDRGHDGGRVTISLSTTFATKLDGLLDDLLKLGTA